MKEVVEIKEAKNVAGGFEPIFLVLSGVAHCLAGELIDPYKLCGIWEV